MNVPAWREAGVHEPASRLRFRLSDLAYAVLIAGLVFAIGAPAVRSGMDRDWYAAALVFTLFGMLLSPVVLICLVIRLSPTTAAAEREAAGLVLKTAVAIVLAAMAITIHGRS